MGDTVCNAKLKELIRKAIGPRTMRSFAQECGISNEHLCRLLKSDCEKIPSTKTLQKIAENAVNHVTLDDLLIAAGKAPTGEVCRKSGDYTYFDGISFGSDVYSFDKEIRELLIAIRGAHLSMEYVEHIDKYLDILFSSFFDKYHELYFDIECEVSYVSYQPEYEYYERGASRHPNCSKIAFGRLSCITRNSFVPELWAKAELYFCLFISIAGSATYYISDTDWDLPSFAIEPVRFSPVPLSASHDLREYLLNKAYSSGV